MAAYHVVVTRICQAGLHQTILHQALLVSCYARRTKPDDRRHQILTQYLRVSATALSRASKKLQGDGLLVRDNATADGRFTILSLTEKGLAMATEIVANGAVGLPPKVMRDAKAKRAKTEGAA
jgi:DNA-binding HxlR family transcriptional regulator